MISGLLGDELLAPKLKQPAAAADDDKYDRRTKLRRWDGWMDG